VDVATYLALLRNTSTLREDARIGRAFVSPLRGLNRVLLPDALLARVATPTHFIWGERDPFGGPSTADGVARRLPNATLEIVPGAGHAPWLDELDHCVGAIREHLAA
jgi:pimeloyl-ACP methyl ester carboxylesterase